MGNRLAALPTSLGGCTSLLRLGLKANQLVALPPSIGRLANLVELYITGGAAPAQRRTAALPARLSHPAAGLLLHAVRRQPPAGCHPAGWCAFHSPAPCPAPL